MSLTLVLHLSIELEKCKLQVMCIDSTDKALEQV